jgi:hypothetical protein
MPEPLDYAKAELNGRTLDFAVNFATSLQLVLCGLEMAVIFVTLKGSVPTIPTPTSDPWAYCFAVQWPGYGLASACAFAGSLSRFVERRRLLYRIYLIAFPTLVGIALIGGFADRKNGLGLDFFLSYPVAAFIANPAMVVLGVRKVRGTLRSAKTRRASPGDVSENRDGALEEIARAVRERG